jgi:hypothetical protein
MIMQTPARRSLCACTLLLTLICAAQVAAAGSGFAIGTNDFLLDGERFQVRCGEMHFARSLPVFEAMIAEAAQSPTPVRTASSDLKPVIAGN